MSSGSNMSDGSDDVVQRPVECELLIKGTQETTI